MIRCLHCKFYVAYVDLAGEKIDRGQCRRSPPRPIPMGGDVDWRWPVVCEHEGCGKGESR